MMSDSLPTVTAKPHAGRPRKFDRDDVVSKAMHVFWANGYSQTSIDDLVEETNVGAQSLYNAFGNKEEIFVQALNLYLSTNERKTQIQRLTGSALFFHCRLKSSR